MKHSRWLVLVLLVALPALAFGQAQTTGRINGKVVDDKGNPIGGATVTVLADALKLERASKTNPSGEFLFSLLPVGEYTVSITADGRQPYAATFRLGVGQTVPVNATLLPGEVVSEEVTVYGTATALETTTVGQNFDYKNQVESLPIQDRAIESVAALSPNISFGPTGGSIAIAGAPSFDTTVLLDGAEVSDPYFGSAPELFIEDAVEEVQVLTSGVSARYGRFQGGVINAITKSGTNEFKGTLRSEFEKNSWNSKTPFGETQDTTLNKTYQATLGGYIVKDRLWFFAGGRTIPTSSNSLTTEFTGQSFTQSTTQDRWQGKLRGAITENHIVDLSYLNYKQTTTNYDGLPAGDISALGQRSDPRHATTLSYQGVLSANTFLEFQGTQKRVQIQAGGDPSKGDPFLDLINFEVFNNHWWDFNDPSVRDNDTAALNLTHSLSTDRLGTHTLEGGLQYVKSVTGGENRQSSTGYNLLTFNTDFISSVSNGVPRYNLRSGEALRWVAIPLGGDQTLENTAAYVQDGITLDKWRFDLGLRYEQYKGSGPLPQFRLKFNDVSPRVGITYSLTPAWQLQATYGKYVSRFNDNVANNITGVSNAPRIETFYLGPDILNASGAQIEAALRNESYWPIVTDFVSPRFPTSYLANDIKSPYANDINFSVRHALPRNSGSVVLSYINRTYKDLIDDYVGNVCDFGIDFGQPCPATNHTVATAPDGTPIEVDSTVWANNPDARRKYNALTAVWDYRPRSNWQFSGNYTYSTLKGNYEGEGQNTPSSGSPLGDYVRAVDLNLAAPYGYLAEDIRHRVIALGTYRFDFKHFGGLTLGSIFRYQSGAPFNLTAQVPYGSVPGYLGNPATYTAFFGGRGNHHFNDFWRADLSTRYELPVFRDLHIFMRASALNVFNNHEVIRFATTGRAVRQSDGSFVWQPVGNCGLGDAPSRTCTGFGRIRNQNDYQLPRTYQIAVGLDF
jgi:outer membrane receptor protein involved in Fe transport